VVVAYKTSSLLYFNKLEESNKEEVDNLLLLGHLVLNIEDNREYAITICRRIRRTSYQSFLENRMDMNDWYGPYCKLEQCQLSQLSYILKE
jgi:hypothetical protein